LSATGFAAVVAVIVFFAFVFVLVLLQFTPLVYTHTFLVKTDPTVLFTNRMSLMGPPPHPLKTHFSAPQRPTPLHVCRTSELCIKQMWVDVLAAVSNRKKVG